MQSPSFIVFYSLVDIFFFFYFLFGLFDDGLCSGFSAIFHEADIDASSLDKIYLSLFLVQSRSR